VSGVVAVVGIDEVDVGCGEDPQRVVVPAAVGCPGGWRRDWLYGRSSQSLGAIDEAVSSLEQCGVLVVCDGVLVLFSRALIRLDALSMIGA
jgi:hypothetical protein